MEKAFIFDMDGTLLNSMIYWYESGARIIKDYFNDPKVVDKIKEMSAREVVIYAKSELNANSVKEFRSRWLEAMMVHYLNDIKQVKGAKEFLDKCKEAGIRMGIATGTNETLSVPALQHQGLLDYFEFVISEDTVGKGKGEPDIYLLACEKLGVTPENCIVFEDGLHGAKTVKKAGFKLVGIYDEVGKHYEEELKELADLYIYDFVNLDLDKILKSL